MIELKEVTKTYRMGGEEIYALNKANLCIADGDYLAVVGPSGSGKSTLANIIGGLDRPDSGDVLVDGQNIQGMNDRDLSRYRNEAVGFVFQSFNLQPNYSALENVMVPLIFARKSPKERTERSRECLRLVSLSDRANHHPPQLSGGQRQRVAIARALANSPKFIIADEPTGNLDSQKGSEIMDLLSTLNSEMGVTLLVITHDMNVAKRAKRIITIHDGKVKE